MENYSFRNHTLKHFQLLMEHNGFTIHESLIKQLPDNQDDLVLWVSAKCKFQIFREHNKVFVEIAPLTMRTLNDWFPVYVVIAFTSDAKAEEWAWLLDFPEDGFSYKTIDRQLSKWHEVVSKSIEQIVSLFEESTFRKIEQELITFRINFYSELSKLMLK